MSHKKTLFLISLLLSVSIVLIGCGKKTAEKATEKALEKATNGQADVDVSQNTVTMNSNGGSWSAGENVSLPDNFPDDVYVVEGKITIVSTVTETNGFAISLETSKSASELKSLYEEKLREKGWNISMSLAYEGSVTIGAEKDNRTVSVSINPGDEGKTIVVLSTSQDL